MSFIIETGETWHALRSSRAAQPAEQSAPDCDPTPWIKMEKPMTNDHKLKTEVLAELAWEPSISSDHIGVTAEGGVVTLTGHVDSYWQKAAAERAVGRVKGVRAIAEEMEVRLSNEVRHGDEEIAAAALHTLAWSTSIPKDAVKVRVQKGYVTLTGQVDWHYQHDEVGRTIQSLSGVTGLANQITVKQRPDTSKIQGDIRSRVT
jgi:osmotically-inducible protein OsmY